MRVSADWAIWFGLVWIVVMGAWLVLSGPVRTIVSMGRVGGEEQETEDMERE